MKINLLGMVLLIFGMVMLKHLPIEFVNSRWWALYCSAAGVAFIVVKIVSHWLDKSERDY